MATGPKTTIGDQLEATYTSSEEQPSAGVQSDKIPSPYPAAKQNKWQHPKQPKRPCGCADYSTNLAQRSHEATAFSDHRVPFWISLPARQGLPTSASEMNILQPRAIFSGISRTPFHMEPWTERST